MGTFGRHFCRFVRRWRRFMYSQSINCQTQSKLNIFEWGNLNFFFVDWELPKVPKNETVKMATFDGCARFGLWCVGAHLSSCDDEVRRCWRQWRRRMDFPMRRKRKSHLVNKFFAQRRIEFRHFVSSFRISPHLMPLMLRQLCWQTKWLTFELVCFCLC